MNFTFADVNRSHIIEGLFYAPKMFCYSFQSVLFISVKLGSKFCLQIANYLQQFFQQYFCYRILGMKYKIYSFLIISFLNLEIRR